MWYLKDMPFKQWSDQRKGAFSALLSLNEFIDAHSDGLSSSKLLSTRQQKTINSLLRYCIENLDSFLESNGQFPDVDFYAVGNRIFGKQHDPAHTEAKEVEDVLNAIRSDIYNFLSDRKELGDSIALLCVGGSHSYGTNLEGSDVDIRGMATNSKMQLFTNNMFESYADAHTDTTIYSFEKLIKLLYANNPNVIEMLGLKQEHYLYVSETGRMLLDQKHIFLSKRIIAPINGCVSGALHKINDFMRNLEDDDIWIHRGTLSFKGLYPNVYRYHCKLYMQAIRLYAMGCDILSTGDVHTYREREHNLLMDIRSGKYLDDNGKPTKEYDEVFNYYKNRFDESAAGTSLPATPSKKKIEKLMYDVNDYICSNDRNYSDSELSFTDWRTKIGKETKGKAEF